MNQTNNGNAAIDRAALVAKIAELRAEELAALPALEKPEDQAHEKFESAKAALADATRAVNEAAAARLSWSWKFSSAIATLEKQLRDSADGSIAAFVIEMQLQEDRERKAGASPVIEKFQTNQLNASGRRRVITRSDLPSRNRRLAAIRAAMLEARDVVALELHDDESLVRRLQQLRDGLPSIEIEHATSGARVA